MDHLKDIRLISLSLNLVLEVLNDFSISLVEHDQLVRDNSHLKERQSLALRPWEAFDNVIALLLLLLFDGTFHNLDNDVIVDVGVGLSGFSYQFTRLSLLDNLVFDRVTEVDAFIDGPFIDRIELLYHAEGDFFRVSPRRSHNHISFRFSAL